MVDKEKEVANKGMTIENFIEYLSGATNEEHITLDFKPELSAEGKFVYVWDPRPSKEEMKDYPQDELDYLAKNPFSILTYILIEKNPGLEIHHANELLLAGEEKDPDKIALVGDFNEQEAKQLLQSLEAAYETTDVGGTIKSILHNCNAIGDKVGVLGVPKDVDHRLSIGSYDELLNYLGALGEDFELKESDNSARKTLLRIARGEEFANDEKLAELSDKLVSSNNGSLDPNYKAMVEIGIRGYGRGYVPDEATAISEPPSYMPISELEKEPRDPLSLALQSTDKNVDGQRPK